MPDFEHVILERDLRGDDRIATITLDRPEKLNAMNEQTRDELKAAFDEAIDDDAIRCIVMRGSGDAFSAGGDLDSYNDMTPAEALDYNTYDGMGLYQWLSRVPKPTVAAIDGYALGGGTEIPIALDFRIATERSEFGLPEIKWGLPPSSAAHRLVHMCGVTKARELLLLGDRFDAEEAAEYGIVNDVVPREEFDDAVYDLADRLASTAPIAYRLTNKCINRALTVDAGYEPLGFEGLTGPLLHGTEEAKEGTQAFTEDRDPDYE